MFILSSSDFFKHLYDHYLKLFSASPLHLCFFFIFFFLPLEHIPLSLHFAIFVVFNFYIKLVMVIKLNYMVFCSRSGLCMLGHILYVPAMHCPPAT